MDLAIQLIANDKTVRSDKVQDLKEFNNQSLATQAKKCEQLVSTLPAIKKYFILLGDDIVDLSTENDALKNRIDDYVEKWLQESKDKLSKQIDNEETANLILSRIKKQMKKFFSLVYNSYNKAWESEFDGIVSEGYKLQNLNINHLKLEVNGT